MSAIITECLMVKAAKGDKAATKTLAAKIAKLRKDGHGSSWPCPHNPPCVATAAGKRRLVRVLTLFMLGPDVEAEPKQSNHFVDSTKMKQVEKKIARKRKPWSPQVDKDKS